jgi:4a-hydroxytetrahydrobiopterin dehydratase
MSPRPPLLPASDIEAALLGLPGWRFEERKLVRAYDLPDFARATACLAAAAVAAAELDHHPAWSGVYTKLAFELWTHDAGGVTRLDLELARRIEALARALGAT